MYGCVLPKAIYSSVNPNDRYGNQYAPQALEHECSDREDCVGYYANAAGRGNWINWIISTDTLPKDCKNKGAAGYDYFWTKLLDG